MIHDWPAVMAQDLLSAALKAYADDGSLLPPDRRGVLFGTLPALNCPQLNVCIANAEMKPFGPKCTSIPRLRIVIWIVRCYPSLGDDGEGPSMADEEAASLILDHDLGILIDGLGFACADGALLPSFPGITCDSVTWGLVQPYGPQGGMAGWQIPFTIDAQAMIPHYEATP